MAAADRLHASLRDGDDTRPGRELARAGGAGAMRRGLIWGPQGDDGGSAEPPPDG